MYIDGLPIWGVVGKEEPDKKFYIFTHKKFDIGYNGKQIVDVNITPENKELLQVGAKIKFTYEVNWKPSNIKFEDRFDKYLDPNFFQHRVSLKKISVRVPKIKFVFLDPLVLDFQFIYDGDFPRWPSVNDSNANFTKRLCPVFQGRGRN